MDASPRISTQPPALNSQDFEFLREQGISEIQSLAANTWTDHNLHDPGITMLEAICYALTETGLRAGMDVKDLIASSSVYHKPDFFTSAQVLPSAPVTLSDFRKILIAHPLISNAWLFPFATVPSGRNSILLEFSDDKLNTSSFVLDITPPVLPKPYRVEVAFPHWNDEDIAPFQQDVVIQIVSFDGPPGNEWNNIVGGQSYVTRALITYQPPVGTPQVMEIWVVADIITEMEDVLVEAPLVLQKVLTMISTLTSVPPDVPILKQLNERVTSAYESMRIIRRYISSYRNLCEDFVEFNAVRLQEIGVAATVEVGSGVNIEELLAEIYYRIYRMISPTLHFKSLADQLSTLGSADLVFDGPLTDSGFLPDDTLANQQIIETIYTSDILRIIYQLRNADDTDVVRRENVNTRRIIAVRNLKLSNFLDNRPISTGARDCLRLINSKNHIPRLSITKSNFSVYRNGVKVSYNLELVSNLFNDKLAGDSQEAISTQLDLPIPQGEIYPVKDFYPIQNDLPIVYGVGEAGLSDQVSTERKAQARQLKGYLFSFEQMLASSQAQLGEFNAFFSADPNVDRTLYQQDLYQIPNIAPLFAGFDVNAADPTAAWINFQNNKLNTYQEVLNNNVETQDQFLERRNAVLDHLLATLGEDMQDRAALLFRLATQAPEGISFSSLSNLLDYQNKQRQVALQDLIEGKSAYYYDLPELNRDKGQAYGNPIWRAPYFLEIKKVASTFEWIIKDQNGNSVFKQFSAANSEIEVHQLAEQAIKLATTPNHYTIRVSGTDRILEIRTSVTANVLAESTQVYTSDLLAQNAILATAKTMQEIWLAYALIPFEWRLYHMLGIQVKERRQLMYATSDFVEIFDGIDPFIEKRFRLWSDSGLTGTELLTGVNNYLGSSDAIAIAAAEVAIQLMIDYGSEIKNYRIENPSPGAFQVALVLPDGNVLARSPGIFTSEADARGVLQTVWSHIYRLLSAAGFYLLENQSLFSSNTTDPALVIADQTDPYSFQATIILPSGYARDFAGGDLINTQPSLYRSDEFRKYAEQQIRKYCPAHILPRIMWVDRIISGEAIDLTVPSFEAFEQVYRTWLQSYLTDEIDDVTLAAKRSDLTQVVNILYKEYYAN